MADKLHPGETICLQENDGNYVARVDVPNIRADSRRLSSFTVPFVVAAGVSALYALALAGSAGARPPECSQSGATVTCTFSTAGEDTFAVPANVSSVRVVANGGGGGASLGAGGGSGAQVTSELSLTPGSNLFVEVGIGGGPAGPGFSGGGGGESDVRTCTISDATCLATGTAQDPRLVVTGGGGGAGAAGSGGGGGAGTATCNPGGNGSGGNVGGGGNGGGCTSGGTGGAGGAAGGQPGGTGTASTGGAAGDSGNGGGGGGAGFWGGGGGGGGGHAPGNGGGGGGGSSFGPTGSVFTTATTGPAVTISYVLTASDLAGILVSDSAGKGPGKALANKAAAIQAAVGPPQTATACAGIADYLGLVNAQTGKHLSASDATTLTNDAHNLALALGC